MYHFSFLMISFHNVNKVTAMSSRVVQFLIFFKLAGLQKMFSAKSCSVLLHAHISIFLKLKWNLRQISKAPLHRSLISNTLFYKLQHLSSPKLWFLFSPGNEIPGFCLSSSFHVTFWKVCTCNNLEWKLNTTLTFPFSQGSLPRAV